MDEKKFFEKLGIYPEEWHVSTTDYPQYDYCIMHQNGAPVCSFAPWENSGNVAKFMAASKQMFLKLFYACEYYYNFIQEQEDLEFFDYIAEPLTLAAGRTWEEILIIAKDCGL